MLIHETPKTCLGVSCRLLSVTHWMAVWAFSYLIFSGSLNKNRGKTLGNHDYFKNNAQVRVTIVVGPMEKLHAGRGDRVSSVM